MGGDIVTFAQADALIDDALGGKYSSIDLKRDADGDWICDVVAADDDDYRVQGHVFLIEGCEPVVRWLP